MGLRRWLAKRKAIKHVKHNEMCGAWHEVGIEHGVIFCGTCKQVFWTGISKKQMEQLEVDAEGAACAIENKWYYNEKEKKHKQAIVDLVQRIKDA